LCSYSGSVAHQISLNLKEAPPIISTLLTGNQNPPSVGEIGGTTFVSDKDLLGLGDSLSADFGFTEGVNSYNLNYNIPVNACNGTLSLHYDNNSSRIVEQSFARYHIKGRTQTYSFGFRQPISRTPQSEFALSLLADVHQSQTFLLGKPYSFSEGPQKGRSRVRAIRFSQDWVQRSRKRVLAVRSQFSFGLGVLGATVNHTGPDGQFFSSLGQFQWVQALAPDTILIARAGAQLTPDSLLPLEQFSIGGIDTVRGYRQNQRVGDNGLVGSLEVALPIVREPKGIGCRCHSQVAKKLLLAGDCHLKN
jgi:hemolysin activation/secretion protein